MCSFFIRGSELSSGAIPVFSIYNSGLGWRMEDGNGSQSDLFLKNTCGSVCLFLSSSS